MYTKNTKNKKGLKKDMDSDWKKAQAWEADWHSTCINSYGEEEKQLIYAKKMGLSFFHDGKTPYNINLEGKSVLDIGGGPHSLLLKAVNGIGLTVVDPLDFPEWVKMRYREAGIRLIQESAEQFVEKGFDEIWVYNCLQHTQNPEKIIKNARKAGKLIRIFEWIDIDTSVGHLHSLSEEKLNEWLGGEGKVEVLNRPTLKGKAFFGIFPT